MPSSTDNKPTIFNAHWWKGSWWLILLCILLVLVSAIYLGTHKRTDIGYENVTMNSEQQKSFTDLISIYTDDDKPTSSLARDTVLKGTKAAPDTQQVAKLANYKNKIALREMRDSMIISFLKNTFLGDIDSAKNSANGKKTIFGWQIDKNIRPTLRELNTLQATSYIQGTRFKVDSYFWLAGPNMYWETIFWSLFGVLTSLIYYVSLANQLKIKKKEDDDIGPFDPSEIPAQVAKMFYAPVVTLVFVIGYAFFSGKNQGVIDISMGHGLILFAFVAGFYSGRLMKMLDSLKNAILPASSDGSANKDTTTTAGTGDISVTVGLADSQLKSPPDDSGIMADGLNATIVKLVPADTSAETITLDKPTKDQTTFTGTKVPFGKYTIKATLSFKNQQGKDIELSASQDIEVSTDKHAFQVTLTPEADTGGKASNE